MPDHSQKASSRRGDPGTDHVSKLAGAALSMVARRPGAPRIDPDWLDRLCAAAISPEYDDTSEAVAEMRAAGLSATEIAETYVPAAARALGDQWCEDEASFARVTIGCSRLHGVLRDLGPEWRPTAPAERTATSVLVLVGQDIYHTLGATVLAGVMRRKGFCVKLWVGARPDQVPDMLQRCEYEAVLISASSGESLEMVRRFVEAVKVAQSSPPLVIVGGTITGDDADGPSRVASLTGADHVTDDPAKAIELCALIKQPNRARPDKSHATDRRT